MHPSRSLSLPVACTLPCSCRAVTSQTQTPSTSQALASSQELAPYQAPVPPILIYSIRLLHAPRLLPGFCPVAYSCSSEAPVELSPPRIMPPPTPISPPRLQAPSLPMVPVELSHPPHTPRLLLLFPSCNLAFSSLPTPSPCHVLAPPRLLSHPRLLPIPGPC